MLNYITRDVGNLPQQLPTGGHLDVETNEVRIDVQKLKTCDRICGRTCWDTLQTASQHWREKKTAFGKGEHLTNGVSPGK